jgi:late competence protein required for DNA uptake (superfamily II DNA/RNA helicase)
VLEDLFEVDCIILDLEERDYVTSTTAYEKLKRKCSHNREAFMYVQERMHDVSYLSPQTIRINKYKFGEMFILQSNDL